MQIREKIDRLKWDKKYRYKFIKISSISLLSSSVVLLISLVIFANVTGPKPENNNIDFGDKGTAYNLEFKDYKGKNNDDQVEKKDEQKEEPNQNNNSHQNNTDSYASQEEHHSEGGGSGGGGNVHVHSWFTVVDQPAWDETVQVQVGTRYICRSCGFVTTDEGAANAHTRQTGHGFRTEGIFEPKVIHHSAITHQECSCGARR